MEIPRLQPGCPWYELSTWALPNVKWCEASQCSWITEPANTWSNLGYVAIGLVLVVLSSRSENRLMRWFGWTQLFVGVSSFVYHASYTFLLQILDFAAMYAFCFLLIVLNLRRLEVLSVERQWRAYAAAVFGLTVVTVAVKWVEFPIQLFIGALIATILITEVVAARRHAPKIHRGWLFGGVGFLGAAGTFSALDASRIFCDPNNHLVQGHAIWHVLSAIALLCAWFAYAPLSSLLAPPTPRPRIDARVGLV